jgi:hypothetical protein
MRHLAVVLSLIVCFLAPKGVFAKATLIHYGWDNPTVSQLPQVLPKLKTSVFDGISVAADQYTEIFRATASPANVHAANLSTLQKLDRTLLKNSYMLVLAKTDGVFDWSNEAHWAATLNNMRLLVKLAKAGGFKGIVFDVEPYGKNPWDYGTQPGVKKLTYAKFASLVRQRGQSMMRMMQKEFPGIEVWGLYGLTANAYDYEEVTAGAAVSTVLSSSGYGLWPSFFNGWIDVADAKTRIIDGNEPAYYYSRTDQFKNAIPFIRDKLADLISQEARTKYKATVKVGQAVYVDAVMNLWGSPRFIGYYFKSDTERAALLYSNTLNALQTSQTLVWVYSERENWWRSPPRAITVNALKKAKAAAATTVKPPVPTTAQKTAEAGVKSAITIGGTFTDAQGKGYAPSSWGSTLNAAACATWGDRGSYSCTFPKGMTVKVTPIVDGKTVGPLTRTLKTLSVSDWSVNWTVR